jgi:hypothetical protein
MMNPVEIIAFRGSEVAVAKDLQETGDFPPDRLSGPRIGRPATTVGQGILGQGKDPEDSGFDLCVPALGEWDLGLLVGLDKTYLTDEDKHILMRSPFFSRPDGEPVLKSAQAVEKYIYDGGSFARYVANGKSDWGESKRDGSGHFRFVEAGRDKLWIRLFDSSRGMALRLPVGGGMCSWSTDDGKTWNALYRVDKAK